MQFEHYLSVSAWLGFDVCVCMCVCVCVHRQETLTPALNGETSTEMRGIRGRRQWSQSPPGSRLPVSVSPLLSLLVICPAALRARGSSGVSLLCFKSCLYH